MPKDDGNVFALEEMPARRTPRQARSVQTVERIKRAMLHIVDRDGYAAATTNRIAEEARVNIASLYRYFPNRASIALAAYESASAGLARQVHDWMTSNLNVPAEESLPALLRLVVDYVQREWVALLRLREEVPELRDYVNAMSLETLAYHSSRLYLEQQLGTMDKVSVERKMFFVQHMGMDLIRRFVTDRPRSLSKSRFCQELAGLIVGYLRSDIA